MFSNWKGQAQMNSHIYVLMAHLAISLLTFNEISICVLK